MRKRTYTALINTELCGSDEQNNTCAKRGVSSAMPVTHKETDLGEATTGPESTTVEEEDDSDTPLTTIHNLVGTCEIASSTVPIDLEYVYKCLPNR